MSSIHPMPPSPENVPSKTPMLIDKVARNLAQLKERKKLKAKQEETGVTGLGVMSELRYLELHYLDKSSNVITTSIRQLPPRPTCCNFSHWKQDSINDCGLYKWSCSSCGKPMPERAAPNIAFTDSTVTKTEANDVVRTEFTWGALPEEESKMNQNKNMNQNKMNQKENQEEEKAEEFPSIEAFERDRPRGKTVITTNPISQNSFRHHLSDCTDVFDSPIPALKRVPYFHNDTEQPVMITPEMMKELESLFSNPLTPPTQAYLEWKEKTYKAEMEKILAKEALNAPNRVTFEQHLAEHCERTERHIQEGKRNAERQLDSDLSQAKSLTGYGKYTVEEALEIVKSHRSYVNELNGLSEISSLKNDDKTQNDSDEGDGLLKSKINSFTVDNSPSKKPNLITPSKSFFSRNNITKRLGVAAALTATTLACKTQILYSIAYYANSLPHLHH